MAGQHPHCQMSCGSSGECVWPLMSSPGGRQFVAPGVSRGKRNTPTAQPGRGDTCGRRFTRHSRVTPRPCHPFRAKCVFVGLTHGSRRELRPAALRAKTSEGTRIRPQHELRRRTPPARPFCRRDSFFIRQREDLRNSHGSDPPSSEHQTPVKQIRFPDSEARH